MGIVQQPAELLASYARKREILIDYLERASLAPICPQGSYFVLCDIRPTLERLESQGVRDDVELAHWLVKEHGVAGVPGSSFYSNPELGRHQIRFHFAAPEKTLHAAGERLLKIIP